MRLRFNELRLAMKFVALVAAFSVLAMGLGYAAPVKAMPGGEHQNTTAGNPSAPDVATGVAATFGIDEGGIVSDNSENATLAAGSGGNLVRMTISWNEIETIPGIYTYAGPDERVQNILDAGMTPLVYLSDNPVWAAPYPCGPVLDAQLGAFENFVRLVADRYKEKVFLWSLYNEVDNMNAELHNNYGGCFASASNGGINANGKKDYIDYAIMLKTAWKAVHETNPNAKFLMGSLAHDLFNASACAPNYPPSWCNGTFSYNFTADLFSYMKNKPLSDGDKYMDGLPFNFYAAYAPYWESVASGRSIQAKANALRKLMKAKGIANVPLYVTETGNDSSSLGLNLQAQCLDFVMVRGAAAKLKSIIWWTFKDYHIDHPSGDIPIHYGLVDEAYATKPSYTAMQVLTTQLNGLKFNANYSEKPGFTDVEAYRFKGGGVTKFVIWSSKIKTPTGKPECSWVRVNRLARFTANKIRVWSNLDTGPGKLIKDNGKKDKDKTVGIIAINAKTTPQFVQINP